MPVIASLLRWGRRTRSSKLASDTYKFQFQPVLCEILCSKTKTNNPSPNQTQTKVETIQRNKTPNFRVPLSLQAKTARISVMNVVALGYRNDVPARRVFSAELDFIFVFHDVFIIFRGFMSVLAGTLAPNFYSF